ncbi:MAG: threonine/serine exporter ThrE family protein [Lachnospiraceae bacterium]
MEKRSKAVETDYELLMEMAMRVGEIMLSHGAEAHRVEDTMCRILKTANLETTEVFVIMTGIFATLAHPGMKTITLTKRVHSYGNNLKYICFANGISREYCEGSISLEEAYERISRGCSSEYSELMHILGNLLVVTMFPILVGGNLQDCLVSFLAGIVVVFFIQLGNAMKIHPFMKDLIAAFSAGAVYLILDRFLPLPVHQDAVIIACIMPLVPGVAITNAIRDTLNGDYVSGTARAMEAFMKAAAIACGVGSGLVLLGGVF